MQHFQEGFNRLSQTLFWTRVNHDQMIQYAFENRCRLAATYSTAGSQQGRDQLARRPFVEMDRHVAILVIVAMEQRELL